MLDTKNYNSSCQFAEEIVSFLYGEMTEKTKQDFESHLPQCNSCNEELSAFGVVRSSISDWKEKEFSTLSMPEIVLPIEEKQKTFGLVETQNRSWFAAIREIFTLSPAWMTATTACAALLICIGLVFVAVSSRNNSGGDIVAGKDKNITTPTPPVKTENTNSSPTNSVSDNQSKDKSTQPTEPPKELAEIKPVREVNKPVPADDVKTVQPKAKVIPATTTNVKKNDSTKVETNRNNKVKKDNNLPNLQDDDEEDDSPRLSDLFDEIGAELK
jgi:hypothetical protein